MEIQNLSTEMIFLVLQFLIHSAIRQNKRSRNFPLSYLRQLMIVRYYIYVINTNLTKGATKLSMKVDLIRLQKPSCNITEAHPKQDVD